ncbi:DUF6197 family protein [Actinacidiphila paucisporea]|uniref:Uncharacterized protein n=1 Tax=Actinacidiphila paucisporea TaxID=310782 RepID=A0A1M6TGH0_9ACTN|nr:hypothetical protein [Actinacidiphila paucisporea]SHK56004.1 hypothetical protein SAMN05216499_10136 [Actinacidiphila paucisporea]
MPPVIHTADPAPAGVPQSLGDVDAAQLVREIEQYLSARTRTTAHPLVTKTTDELIAEAFTGLNQPVPTAEAPAAPVLAGPGRLLRVLPDWALSLPVLRTYYGGGRHLTAAEHLQLTALVIERYGWSRGHLRSTSGRRCILGAQAVLFRLGYGDESTVHTAAGHLQGVLRARGITQPYHAWNDTPGRTQAEVLHLIREAANHARR